MNYLDVYRMMKTANEPYTVKAGDTLGGIAQANKLKLADLTAWNNIKDPNKIRVGQKLNLSAPATTAPTTTPTPVTPTYNQYKIKAGDNYDKIGKGLGISSGRISAANPGIDPNKLQIGQTINVPKLNDIDDIKARTGFDPTTPFNNMDTVLDNIWTMESSRGKNLSNPASTASGHYHMLDKTFSDTIKEFPTTFKDWKKSDLNDYTKATQMAKARLNSDLMRLQKEEERAATDADAYAIWHGGYGGRKTQGALDYAAAAGDPKLKEKRGFK